ncbi:MAG: hypothetical protein FJ147_18845 [Deltaproteobacteria bacterium]|nr:hypothetical protein [Deltaproteobacteria bacterium]
MARTFELATPIDGTVEEAWRVLTDFAAYVQWNRLVPFGHGSATPGTHLEFRLRGRPGRRRPRVVTSTPPQELVLQDTVGHKTLLHMTHWFTFVPAAQSPGVDLCQRWRAEGMLVPLLWPLLRRDMARFAEFGHGLRDRVRELRQVQGKT